MSDSNHRTQLFTEYRLGPLTLPNRVVMAPMTRSRAVGGLPNALMRDYYAQRASAGLIITEGIAPSPNALGYARIPGLFSTAQIEGFRTVTEAVHAASGRIVAQLMHVGRIAHPLNQPQGARVLAPSAVRAAGEMYTDEAGPQPFPTPVEMTASDLRATREEIVQAAKNAIAAGFDAVELHGANGYLLEQFLHPHTNRRSDEYGGSAANRARFVIETLRDAAEAIGTERLALRISPYNSYNDLPESEHVDEQYSALVDSIGPLLYLHVVRNPHPRFPTVAARIRRAFPGALVLNGGFDRASAEEAITSGHADLVSFGRSFIANPDLVQRMRSGAALAEAEPQTFYTPGPRGYLDYPTA